MGATGRTSLHCSIVPVVSVDMDKRMNEVVVTNLYDEEEVHTNCTVQIWKNTTTGEVSIGWWENNNQEEKERT